MFGWIILAALFVCSLSVLIGALVGLKAKNLHAMVCYAIGALLGAVFLEVLPHALHDSHPHTFALILLCGILGFFILEKLVLWRHCHHNHCEVHGETHAHLPNRSGFLILIGDSFHNFADGALIAAAFLESQALGFVMMWAILAHEIPQEIGDFAILRHSGFSFKKALGYNFLSNLAMILGAAISFFLLEDLEEILPFFLGLAASSMLYVAMADLIPGLHHKTALKDSVWQIALIILGILSIVAVQHFVGHSHA